MFLENTSTNNEQFGSIEVICGSMFSGKTEELLRRIKRAKFANLNFKIFKPSVDVRHHKSKVVSHDQNEIVSTPIACPLDILSLAKDCSVVGIDEAQFFNEKIVSVCNDLANAGVRVIVAGLDMDFKGKPFGPMPNLMAIAEYVTKVHAVCPRTGGLANFSFRKTNATSQVVLGEKDQYEPLSRSAFYKAVKTNRPNSKRDKK